MEKELVEETLPAETASKKDLLRALRVIENLAMHENPDEDNKAWSTVYRLSHAFAGHCGNSHENWRAELDEAEKTYGEI